MIMAVIFDVRFQNSRTKKVRIVISFIEMPSIQNTKGILCGKTDGYSFGGTLPTTTSYRIGKKNTLLLSIIREVPSVGLQLIDLQFFFYFRSRAGSF